jgi:error-prone DNA polymerase
MKLRLVPNTSMDDRDATMPVAVAEQRLPEYAELHCLSNFSFQRGASTAKELFARAKQQGYTALAITDECSLAGIVRALQASEMFELPLIVGAEMPIEHGPKLVLLAETLAGYQALCGMITRARRRAEKGSYRLLREDFDVALEGLLALWIPGVEPDVADAAWVQAKFPQRCWLAVELHRGPDDAARLRQLLALSQCIGMPAVASGDVHMHVRGRRELQDTMTAIRLHTTLAEAGLALFPNGERHLRPRRALSAIHPRELMEESVRIARRCSFDMKRDLRYEYPRELVPAGHTPRSWLRRLTYRGIEERWARNKSTRAQRHKAVELIEKELRIIGKKRYESYFLTVHDIVAFARSRKILCQGRGSAANSAVCYALGITELQPGEGETQLLFERFVSIERNEPPDIDVDFEHERREEVLQYVFGRYGRERAALTAVAIQYRGRSAVRDVAKALGVPMDQIDEMARTFDRWSGDEPAPGALEDRGLDVESPLMRRVLRLTDQLIAHPRHLSQHPGGFVISEYPLSTLVPVENAAMDGRTVVQWDKDDLDALKLLKVDCLALGMLTCLRKTFGILRENGRRDLDLDRIPREDKPTYDMISAADTIGVFQIESRAQMAMLPRLKPEKFYDLVIQVAIVRPGPIQGDMVHPYLRRRNEEEPVTYPTEAVREVFKRTLGVPLFQEQVMQLAIVAAGYSAGEADQLRRSMAAWKRYGGLEPHREKLIGQMLANGYDLDFAQRIFRQIEGFGSYGFPESHAASFALLAYVSSWLKRHEPAAFAAGLINSQPMGFYSPSQIVQDLRRHGVRVLPVDVRYSCWDCTLEESRKHARDGVRMRADDIEEKLQSPGCDPPVAKERIRSLMEIIRELRSRPQPVALPGEAADAGRSCGGEAACPSQDSAIKMAGFPRARQRDAEPSSSSLPSFQVAAGHPAMRLGLRMIDGLKEDAARRIETARTQRPFADVADLCLRAGLDQVQRGLLADAGALRGLAGHRHRARWAAAGVEASRPLFEPVAPTRETAVALPLPTAAEEVRTDYATMGLTLGRHPLQFLRDQLRARRYKRSSELRRLEEGHVAFAGIVTMRQSPQTATGVTFLTLEDEDGWVNVVVWRQLADRQRRELLESRLLGIDGRVESKDGVQHLIAEHLENLSPMLGSLPTFSRDFH